MLARSLICETHKTINNYYYYEIVEHFHDLWPQNFYLAHKLDLLSLGHSLGRQNDDDDDNIAKDKGMPV